MLPKVNQTDMQAICGAGFKKIKTNPQNKCPWLGANNSLKINVIGFLIITEIINMNSVYSDKLTSKYSVTLQFFFI